MYLLPSVIVFIVTRNSAASLCLAGVSAIVVVPLYVRFGRVARIVELSPTGISAETYDRKRQTLEWGEIVNLCERPNPWFSFYKFAYLRSTTGKPIIVTEAISEYPILITKIQSELSGLPTRQ